MLKIEQEILELAIQLDDYKRISPSIIPWAAPVISFGSILDSKIATIGLNPSNLEFVDTYGKELIGSDRRFPTLDFLKLKSWKDIDHEGVVKILESCNDYFVRNPYDRWFKKLDYIISMTSFSYYFPSRLACHLDLTPYATSVKWGELNVIEKSCLLEYGCNKLAHLLQLSPIETIVLNGKSVVDNLQRIAKVELKVEHVKEWDLPRAGSNSIKGFCYTGCMSKLSNIDFGRKILILGFNHNLQSSYGVTKKVQESIREWIGNKVQ